jgi:hypothetical protein
MSNASETALLNLLFVNAAFAGIGDAGGIQPSAAAGNFYVSLHTSTGPGEAGDQTTNEANYGGYARVAVSRMASAFTVLNNTVSNAQTVQFAECTSSTSIVTYFAVGLASSSTGTVLYSGTLSDPRTVSAGITPLFNVGALQGTID